jgi:Flp pilus assembly pilin Flp
MNRAMHTFNTFLHDQSGQDLVEFAMAAAVLGAMAVVALRDTSSDAGRAFNAAASSIASRF